MNTSSFCKLSFLLAGTIAFYGCVYVPYKSTYLHLEKKVALLSLRLRGWILKTP